MDNDDDDYLMDAEPLEMPRLTRTPQRHPKRQRPPRTVEEEERDINEEINEFLYHREMVPFKEAKMRGSLGKKIPEDIQTEIASYLIDKPSSVIHSKLHVPSSVVEKGGRKTKRKKSRKTKRKKSRKTKKR
jgi:hypothetical protein